MINNSWKIIAVVLVGAVLISIFTFIPLGGLGQGDFLPYWSAAYLLARGGDPYDRASLDQVYRMVVPDGYDQINPAWNPPWLLLALTPLALLPFDVAAHVWLLFNLLVIGGLPLLIWRWLSGPSRSRAPMWTLLLGLGFGESPSHLWQRWS